MCDNTDNPIMRVIEECGELTQALYKVERFGWFTHHPDRPNQTNMDEVFLEMNDVLDTMMKLTEHMQRLKSERAQTILREG